MNDPLSVLTAVLAQEVAGVLLDQLGQKFMEKTGCSWNKMFKKQFGPIRKFVQNHSDAFVMVSNGSRVTLRNPSGSHEKRLEPGVVSQEKVESDQSLGAEPVNEHWFDLNDTVVTAIRERDIMKQYEGRESAYMLFYRKHTLLRPPEALGDPTYGVPAHLLQMVQEENSKLQERRAEFELNCNRVELHFHLASHYRVQNAALQTINTHRDIKPLTMTFDHRRSVGELRLALRQMQDVWEGDMVITIAKNLPAGLHLYDTLTDDQQSLYSAGLCNGSDLFVWNGREVNGVCVQTGPEWEPLLLNILRPDWTESDSNCIFEPKSEEMGLVGHVMQGFSAGATLEEIRETLSTHKALVCQQEKGVEPGGGGASRWNVCSPDVMRRPLKELTLRDGDTLLLLPETHVNTSVFSLSDGVVTVTTPLDCRWLQVHCHTEVDEDRGMKIPASGDTLVREVKDRALDYLQLLDLFRDIPCCLRPMDSTGKLLPPVCDNLSVRDAGIKLMTSLYLCRGHAPSASQRFLFYRVSPSAAQEELEIIVEQTITVKECIMEMLQKAGLNGTCWHLCRLDWCEDVGEPLIDENLTLSDAGVANGDTLVLTEGQLPPEGYIKLAVSWLVDQSEEFVINHTETSLITMRSVGCAEISEEASLQELKCQIMTLPALLDLSVPSTDFLRVWLMERKKLSRIIRGNHQTLRKLKFPTGCEICVQTLLCEENLRLNDILLRLQMGVAVENKGGVEDYFHTHDFVWEAGSDPSPKGLYHAVSTHCGIEPENLLIAKYQPEQHIWITIDYGNQSEFKQKKRKQKKSKRGVNLQVAPYSLRDGDTIRVKNLLIDSNREFGHAGQKTLRVSTEQRTTEKNNRKPEVALSINVGVFR